MATVVPSVVIVTALRTAAEQYRKDAAACGDIARLRDGFIRQAEQCEVLAKYHDGDSDLVVAEQYEIKVLYGRIPESLSGLVKTEHKLRAHAARLANNTPKGPTT